MSYRKRGGGLLGLLIVAVLGAMALAGSAQAVVPKFNLNGATPHFTVTGTQEGTATLLVPNSNLSLRCTEFEVQEGLVLVGGLLAHVKLLYKGCSMFEHKSPFAELPCHVSDVAAGKADKLHVTAEALLLPIEFADGKYGILAEKLNVQLNELPGTGCPLPLKNVVKGEICFKIQKNISDVETNDTAAVLIQSSKTIQAECPVVALEGTGAPANDKLLFGANEAFVEGSAILKDAGGIEKIGVLLL